jgi:ATP/maltotriose-dependent transcriptional regulator MalT/DNA-binding SARP family transcriptional activator
MATRKKTKAPARARAAPAKPATAAPPAKFTRPRLYRVRPRERLFRLLDERREHPVLWVTGAPGAGKSALLASYIDARRLTALWYNVDAGDGDPATFFYFLGQAAAQFAGPKAPPLPLFTDEYRRDLAGFGRRWFREFFARLPAGAVVVFDNVHEAEGRAEARAAVLEEIPVGVNVILVSRLEPPSAFARMVANQTLARIGPEELRFTREEAAALLDGAGEAALAERAWARADGWAAGLILMREQLQRGAALGDDGAAATPEAVFAYFAGEIFDRIPPQDQRLLVLMALPPRIPASVAVELTGEARAPKLLEAGYRRHLFIARRDGPEPVYEFHALFRDFLLERARRLVPAGELAAARRRVAAAGEARGLTDKIFELYSDAEDWPNAVRVLLAEAPPMLAQGRFESVAARIDALPAQLRAEDADVAYWEGVARMNVDPVAAGASLERAYERYKARGDAAGQIRAVEAEIVSHYLSRSDWRPVDRWLDVMEGLLERTRTFASPEAEARAVSSLAIGLVYRQPGHPQLPAYLDRLDGVLDAVADRNARVAVAARLIDGLNKVGELARSERVAERIAPHLDHPEVRPITRAWCRVWLAQLAIHRARMADYDALLESARAITQAHGLGFFEQVIEIMRAWGMLARGRLQEAARLLVEIAARMDASRKLDLALLHYLRSWHASLAGDPAEAEREGRTAAQVSLETGSINSTLTCHTGLALALDLAGNRAAALGVLERMKALVPDVRGGMIRFHAWVWEAYLRLRAADPGYRAPLEAAFRLGRREGYLNNYTWWPPMMSRLCAAALEAGIEPDYVRRLVAARELAPPPGAAPEAWPWPLRIHALGPFRVLRDGAPLRFATKAQKKPLELVKALVALGGEGVDSARLAAILWPDAGGDAAKVSFDSTLYRLRKLLGLEAALVLNEGKLSLDPRHCWVDVDQFDRAARAADAVAQDAAATPERVAAAAAELRAAYPGHFLAGDEDQGWLMPMRDRLRAKLVRTALALGRRLQAAGRLHEAAELYERTLELDNLAEELYRQLMLCQRDLGERAAALRTYRRCRELLSVVLGAKPAPETEAVRRSLDLQVP